MNFFACRYLEPVTIIQTSIDCDGDDVVVGQFTTSAVVRENSAYNLTQSNNSFTSDSMVWLNPEDANVLSNSNDLVGRFVVYDRLASGTDRRDYYKITTVIPGKTLLSDNRLLFFKCLLKKSDKPTLTAP
jgi:hypothetical protein